MAVNKRKYFDQAIGESEGNGGDLQQLGNDLALVFGQENQVYLALFGGDPNGNWWGNNLFFPNNSERQFVSKTEYTLDTTELSSAGRIKIESAVKDDLQYLVNAGVAVTVSVSLPGVNMVKINIRLVYPDGSGSNTIITFGKRSAQGDFSILDFNEDFF